MGVRDVGGGTGSGVVVHAAMHTVNRRAVSIARMGFPDAESSIKHPRS